VDGIPIGSALASSYYLPYYGTGGCSGGGAVAAVMVHADSRFESDNRGARGCQVEGAGGGKWEGESAETDRRIAKIARTSVDSAPFFDTNYTLGTVDVLHTESYVKT